MTDGAGVVQEYVGELRRQLTVNVGEHVRIRSMTDEAGRNTEKSS
jgi:hypothetical protein